MKKTIAIVVALAASFCFGFFVKSQQAESVKQTPKVVGVGGIFFRCKDPKKVKEWYKTHLGFDTNNYGATFKWQEGNKQVALQWSTFRDSTKYFNPSTKDFMINYRVDNLTDMVTQLKKDGVTLVDTMESSDYGKFIHIMDNEGNKIELWEPVYAYDSKK
jgi:predicted enzyme related to lactoylglutathione lyase